MAEVRYDHERPAGDSKNLLQHRERPTDLLQRLADHRHVEAVVGDVSEALVEVRLEHGDAVFNGGHERVETDLDTEGQVRLPKVSVFGKDQNFLWRDTPATWRTDAILAATQTALLPDAPAELREGWIRVAPTQVKGGDT